MKRGRIDVDKMNAKQRKAYYKHLEVCRAYTKAKREYNEMVKNGEISPNTMSFKAWRKAGGPLVKPPQIPSTIDVNSIITELYTLNKRRDELLGLLSLYKGVWIALYLNDKALKLLLNSVQTMLYVAWDNKHNEDAKEYRLLLSKIHGAIKGFDKEKE